MLDFVLTFAPAPVRLDMVKFLVDHRVDFNAAADKDTFLDDLFATGDGDIMAFLLPRLWKTETNRGYLESVINYEFRRYAKDFYYASRGKRHCRKVDYPEFGAVARWEDLAKYAWLAPRMKLPSPKYLEVAMNCLQQFRPVQKQPAGA